MFKLVTRLLLLLLICQPFRSFSQCAPGYSQIRIELMTDNYPTETAYTVKDQNGTVLYSFAPSLAYTLYVDSFCVVTGSCLNFEITDTYGDGICCTYGNGYYNLFLDGALMATGGSFLHSEKHHINCPPGTSCDDAFTAYPDTMYYASGSSTWYQFTPDTTGAYNITTCFPSNHCDTRIWVYDHCSNLNYDSTNLATIYYSDNVCGNLAYMAAGLQAGLTYWIRIGGTISCIDSTVQWQMTYGGPVVGCTDPAACNYNPLATVSNGTCIYPGDPNCLSGPDLMIDSLALASSISVGIQNGNDVCLIGEGCLAGYGVRQILNFTTTIRNIGDQDYYIGAPTAGNSQFVYDQCHNHYHYVGYANYELYDINQQPMQSGFKNGFCVLDLMCFTGTAKYGCNNMGISAGCADSYSSGLACQWLDITDIPNGQYTLVVKVNWDHSPDKAGRIEQRYDNNVAYVCLNLTRNSSNTPTVTLTPGGCQKIVDCAGDTFGLAVNDCMGNCNGTRLSGDMDVDADQDSMDVTLYMDSIVNAIACVPCNDLTGEGLLTVMDAARLQACVRNNGGTHTHPPGTQNTHRHCQFPFNIVNINDSVSIGMGTINTGAKYFEINVLNPTCYLLGLDFDLSGVQIDSIVSLQAGFNPAYRWNNANGRVVMLDTAEVRLPKHQTVVPLMRVYYSSLTSNTVCISALRPAVNGNYEDTKKGIFNGCFTITGLGHQYNGNMLSVQPNPSNGVFTLRTETLNMQDAAVEVFDAFGKSVFNQRQILSGGDGTKLDLSNLKAGVYILKVHTAEMEISNRIVIAK